MRRVTAQASPSKEDPMRKRFSLSVLMVLTLFFVFGVLGQAYALTFNIQITNLSPNVLSPTAFITHDMGFDLFDDGSMASSAVELLAETGNNSMVLAQAAASASVYDYVGASGGPIAQGLSYTVMIEADMAHPWLSFMSMMGVSNDGFIGGTTGDGAIKLFTGGVALNDTFIILPDDVWDAGTEVNDESAASVGALGAGPTDGIDENGYVYKPHLGILGNGDIPLSFNWTEGPVAQIKITPAPVPEPATLILFSMGLFGFAGYKKKKLFKK